MTLREGDGGAPAQPGLAPVTYLPGVVPVDEPPARWAIPLESNPHDADDDAADQDEVESPDSGDAETLLARRLRRSALSEREARAFLAQHGIDPSIAEATLVRFADRGWIDDAVLAEQLLHAGTSRKGQGRRAIAQTLSTRGIAREVADAALAALPDDDEERALEYAHSKAHGLRSYDLETAMRRLMGQLARRGYSGSVASHAARTALTEQRSSDGSGGGGVRFR